MSADPLLHPNGRPMRVAYGGEDVHYGTECATAYEFARQHRGAA